MSKTTLHNGDCLEVMRGMDANSVDTVLTDPPYGLRFMGNNWDNGIPGVAYWDEALRVAKPGALLLAFGGTRTHHRLMCAIEDAGWEIRDCMMWLYGSGFPKSHNFSTKLNGDGDRWKGWGTALKPGWEPIIVAMKPLDGTFANNAEAYGVAGMWIDGGRIAGDVKSFRDNRTGKIQSFAHGERKPIDSVASGGRWPANLILDDDAGAAVDKQSGHSVSRFFYCAKASSSERNAGLEGLQTTVAGCMNGSRDFSLGFPVYAKNHHPTIKPLKLIQYLARLTKTPTGGVILDPFMGSGTTGVAAIREGRDFIGIDKEPQYMGFAERRIEHAQGRAASEVTQLECAL